MSPIKGCAQFRICGDRVARLKRSREKEEGMSNMLVSDALASARQWVLHSERVFSVEAPPWDTWHEGAEVEQGTKYMLRSDAMHGVP
jgi:hypothetical protein